MGDPLTTGIFGAKGLKSLMTPPDIPDPKVAPIPDEGRRKRSAQRSQQRKYAGAGRAGTLLTSGDKLG